jgi:hypothetical protein
MTNPNPIIVRGPPPSLNLDAFFAPKITCRTVLRELIDLAWFGSNLAEPARFNRTRSKGYYRRQTRGIACFRQTAAKHITRAATDGRA